MFEDQAAGLRSAGQQRPVRTIAITGGKGGVGKTSVSVNLGVALSKMGERVCLLDADMSMANVDVLLGLRAPFNLSHVLDGTHGLKEVMIEGPGGLKIIPGSSGVRRMANLSSVENAGLIQAFSELADDIDVLLIDTAAGISDSVLSFCRAAMEVLVVVCDEPASITDAYALIKVLNREYGVSKVRIVANMAQSPSHATALFDKIASVCERFLDVQVSYAGPVPFDPSLRVAIQQQTAVVLSKPFSPSGKAFSLLAREVMRWPVPMGPSGYLQFFVERLVQSGIR
ncbi:MAG: MinD/ParA family protein [Gammaproteobacteria bacterium]|nr:MinD/ParA family protein [Gammaproteobacteria bacterium]